MSDEAEPGSQESFEQFLDRWRRVVVLLSHVSASVAWFCATVLFARQAPYKERVAETVPELWHCFKVGFMTGFSSGRFGNERRLAFMRLEQRHPELRLPVADGTGP